MAALGGRLRDEPLGQRVEDGEAEGLVRFDLLCVAPIDGDERRAARASRPWRQCGQREREEAGEGAGEHERARAASGSLSTAGGTGWHGASARFSGDARERASRHGCGGYRGKKKEKNFREPPA